MNDQAKTTHPEHIGDDSRLELMLEVCRPEPIDNTRIKQLVHEKIMREKMAQKRRRRRIVFSAISAVACLAVLIVLALDFFTPSSQPLSTSTLADLEKAGYRELVVAPGQQTDLTLPDGSHLVANARSRVLYPKEFRGKERRIFASGEVYLEVAKDKDHPFVVESDGFDVRVLGTIFNIYNTTDSTASVVLVEGSVEVTTDSEQRVRMKPSDLAELVNGEVISLHQVDTSEYTAWTKGLLVLRGESLSSLADMLSRHYGVAIECDSSLSDVKVYGKLDLKDGVEQVLSAIREIVPMKVIRENDGFTMKSAVVK